MDASYDFTSATTVITLGAWTACGKVEKFQFAYALYAITDTCNNVPMSISNTYLSNTDNNGAICAYSKSDFAPVYLLLDLGMIPVTNAVCRIQEADAGTTDFNIISATNMALSAMSSIIRVKDFFGISLTTDGVRTDSKKVKITCEVHSCSSTNLCSTTFTVK